MKKRLFENLEAIEKAKLLEEIEQSGNPEWLNQATAEQLGIIPMQPYNTANNANELRKLTEDLDKEALKEMAVAEKVYKITENYKSKDIENWIKEAFEDSTTESFLEFVENWRNGVDQWH